MWAHVVKGIISCAHFLISCLNPAPDVIVTCEPDNLLLAFLSFRLVLSFPEPMFQLFFYLVLNTVLSVGRQRMQRAYEMLLSPGADVFNARHLYIIRICLKSAARIAVWLECFDALSSK